MNINSTLTGPEEEEELTGLFFNYYLLVNSILFMWEFLGDVLMR